MSSAQIIIIVLILAGFVGLGFALNMSIKKHEAKSKNNRKKKGRSKYMQQSKNPGRK